MSYKKYIWINRKPKEIFDVVTSRTTVCYTHFIDGRGQRVANANIRLLCNKDGVSLETGENFAQRTR